MLTNTIVFVDTTDLMKPLVENLTSEQIESTGEFKTFNNVECELAFNLCRLMYQVCRLKLKVSKILLNLIQLNRKVTVTQPARSE